MAPVEPERVAYYPACRPARGQPQERVMNGQVDWYYFRKG